MYLENFAAKLDWRLPIFFLLLVVPVSAVNFALYHTLVEGVAVMVAVLAFVVTFNTYPFSKSHFLMFLGCGYFWVGMLDFFHTITFLQLGIFPDISADMTLQFWLFARLLEASVLVAFTHFVDKAINRNVLFWFFMLVFIVALLLVFSGVMPAMFDAKTGLSKAKIAGEFIVIGLLLWAAWRLWQRRSRLNRSVLQLFLVSIGLTIAAEICFMLYTDFFHIMINLGHILKLMSFWLVYVAVVESTLTQPFKSLSLSSDTFNALPDAITVVDEHGVILHANNSARMLVKGGGAVMGMHIHEAFHSSNLRRLDCPICRSISVQHTGQPQEVLLGKKWHEISLSPINYYGKDKVLLHVSRDVTVSKEAQLNYQTADKLYTLLRLTNKAIISSKNKQDLLDSVCHIAVQHGGFAMAWIGMIEDQQVIPVSADGDRCGYLTNINVRIDDSELAKGPVGIAVKSRNVAYVNSIETDPSFAPWRQSALACGYKSIAAVPVLKLQHCVGVFVIYAGQQDAFDSQTLELLSSLSDDISSVIAFIQVEEKRMIAEEKLRQLSQAIEQSKSAIVITDVDGTIEYVNAYHSQLTGYKASDMLGKNMSDITRLNETKALLIACREKVLNGENWHGEIQSLHQDGTTFWALQSVAPVVDKQGNIDQIVWTAEDNTELHNANKTISQLAYFDSLTNLPNRRLYHDRFKQAISAAKRHGTRLAIFYLDLDNFKTINDSRGHDFGDELLKHVAVVLTKCVREMDTVSRLGGDEFSIIVNDIIDNSHVVHIADNILNKLNRKTVVDGRELTISTSIGISLYPTDGESDTELMKHADMAMYHAKEKGKNNFKFFEAFLNIKAQQRLLMEERIQSALDSNVFELYYQPQFDINSGEISGVEALIRWPNGQGGFTSPVEFIPIAEQTSLIIDIGNWVIWQACHEFKRLIDNGFTPVKVAVNISASQFKQSRVLLDTIEKSLRSSGLPNELLQLELTEGVLIDDVEETIAVIDQLKRQNISFAIDDFGTGYSSLSYLKSFPADIIKIDRSFVLDIENDVNDQAIIRAICVMAHELDLKVLAEGVETEAQLAFLRSHQCDFVQGYYYAKPMPGNVLLSQYT